MRKQNKILTGWVVYLTIFLAACYAWAADGDEKWRIDFDAWVESSPAIAPDGTIYACKAYNHLYSINPDGSIRWSFDIGYARSAPAVGLDGIIYVYGNGNIWAVYPHGTDYKWKIFGGTGYASRPTLGNYGNLYAGHWGIHIIDMQIGQEVGRFDAEDQVLAPASIGPDGNVYFGDLAGYVYSYTQMNVLNWRYRTQDEIHSAPAIHNDGTVYINSNDGYLYAFASDGTLKWRFLVNNRSDASAPLNTGISSPAIGVDGTIYVGSFDNSFYAVNSDGTLQWAYPTQGMVLSSPAIGADGTIFVGSNDNRIYAFNAGGTLKWSFETEGEVHSSPAIASDGTVYVGSRIYPSDGTLYAIEESCGGPAQSSWPMLYHNPRRTGSALPEDVLPGEDNDSGSADRGDTDNSRSDSRDDGNNSRDGGGGGGGCFILTLQEQIQGFCRKLF